MTMAGRSPYGTVKWRSQAAMKGSRPSTEGAERIPGTNSSRPSSGRIQTLGAMFTTHQMDVVGDYLKFARYMFLIEGIFAAGPAIRSARSPSHRLRSRGSRT